MARIKIIGLLCALGLSLVATSLPAGQREIGFFAQTPIHAWHGQRFTVIRIDSINEFDGFRGMLENWIGTYPDQVEALQGAIRANGALAAALRSQHVQINNIAATQQAFNGNLIFYLR